MSAERGTTLEILQYKAQKVARTIPKITERRREAVRDLHAWEDVVSSTGRDARLSASQNVLRGFLHTTESQIDSEKERLISLALENNKRTQSFLSYSDLYNQGILNPEVFAQKRSDFRAYRETIINFEVHQGEILFAEERKKQKKAQNKGREYQRDRTVYFAGQAETEPAVFFVNKELKAIASNGHEVRFEEGAEWQTVLLLAAVNTDKKYRRDGQYLSSSDIKKYFAERGVSVNVAGVIANISQAVGPDNSGVIERLGRTRGTKYRLSGKAVFFNGPVKAYRQAEISLDSAGMRKVVSIGEYSRRRDAELERAYPDVRQAVCEILELIKDKGVVKPVISSQVGSYFRNLGRDFRDMMETKRYVSPATTGRKNYHKAYSIPDIAVMLFTKEAGRFLSPEQYTELRKIIREEIARESSGLARPSVDQTR